MKFPDSNLSIHSFLDVVCQNVDLFEGETGSFIESIVLNNGQGKNNNFQLYLSGDESTPLTMTPSCEKVCSYSSLNNPKFLFSLIAFFHLTLLLLFIFFNILTP